MLRSTSITALGYLDTAKRRIDGRALVADHAHHQVEVLEAAEPDGEPDGDARLLVRADAAAAPERQARRRRRGHGEEAAGDPDPGARAERRQAGDAGAAGCRGQPRGSRAPGARAQGVGAA